MREETLNPMQEAIAFGRVIPGAAAEFTNERARRNFTAMHFRRKAMRTAQCGKQQNRMRNANPRK